MKFVLPLALGALGACHAGGRVGPVHAGGGVTDNSASAKKDAKAPTPAKTAEVAQTQPVVR
ncbi:MAG TPA: hypothetical protein VGF94_14605 [Kofleriaceae bacterium]